MNRWMSDNPRGAVLRPAFSHSNRDGRYGFQQATYKDPIRERRLFRSADSLFKRQANETLIGNTCAGGAFAYSVVKLAGQTQVD